MKKLLLPFLLLFASCPAGTELLRIEVQSNGVVNMASNGNQAVIASDGSGHIAATMASQPFLPVYPPKSWSGAYHRVISRDPEYDQTFAPGELLPPEAEVIVRKVMTDVMIFDSGIRFSSAP